MQKKELDHFTDTWLNSWTGNNPEKLLTFYDSAIFYLDPANPNGLKGIDQLTVYFKKLLQKNPEWKWTREEIFITEKGFTLKWKAQIPVKNETIIIFGLDIVELNNEKISRNEVYFDRHDWLLKMLK